MITARLPQISFGNWRSESKRTRGTLGLSMEMSKSKAIWDIVYLIRLNVITYDDLQGFSDELKQEVTRIQERNRG